MWLWLRVLWFFVSFRPVSASSLSYCYGCRSGLSIPWSAGALSHLMGEKPGLGEGFPLRCFQRLSCPNVAIQRCPLVGQLVDQRFVRPGPLVLGTAFLKLLTRAADRDRTVSRRSKPSSRAALMGEQPNPWDLLQPQDATSRHRGAKPSRRYGLLGRSACYPRGTFYPLSDTLPLGVPDH